MEEVLSVANGPVLWILALLIISVVVAQAIMYLRMTLNFSNQFNILSKEDKSVVYKTAIINSIGPAVAIFFVAVSLMTIVGGPITLMRIGVIGSAHFEAAAAGIGAEVVGAKIGTDSYTLTAFAASVWIMTLGGMGWLITTLLVTKKLDQAQDKLSVSNPALVQAAGTATPIAIFVILAANSAIKKEWLSNIDISVDKLIAIITSAVLMFVLHQVGKKISWLREWNLGFSLVAGIAAGFFSGQMLG